MNAPRTNKTIPNPVIQILCCSVIGQYVKNIVVIPKEMRTIGMDKKSNELAFLEIFLLIIGSFIALLISSSLVHEITHGFFYWLGSVPIQDIHIGLCGINPCVYAPSYPIEPFHSIGNFSGGMVSAVFLIMCYWYAFHFTSVKSFLITGGVASFLASFQLISGLMEGFALSWYLDPRYDTQQTPIVLLGCSIALLLHGLVYIRLARRRSRKS